MYLQVLGILVYWGLGAVAATGINPEDDVYTAAWNSLLMIAGFGTGYCLIYDKGLFYPGMATSLLCDTGIIVNCVVGRGLPVQFHDYPVYVGSLITVITLIGYYVRERWYPPHTVMVVTPTLGYQAV